jgi:hypothetical protein
MRDTALVVTIDNETARGGGGKHHGLEDRVGEAVSDRGGF